MRIGRGGRRHWMKALDATLVCGTLLAGCAPQPPPQTLESGYAAFNAGRYKEAYDASAGVLKAQPAGGPNTSAALYLQGRVLEQRAQDAGVAGDSGAMAANLQSARDTYARALSQNPNGGLEASIRSQLANVAYFQDDYAAALEQWTATFPKLDALAPAAATESKPWTLYRIGLCQQRLGRFGDADATFAKVQKLFPGTEAASRAASHEGATAFGVQVGTFANDANAQSVVSSLRAEGLATTLTPDSAGRRVVRVGPLPTYDQARTIRNTLAVRYPGAIIIP